MRIALATAQVPFVRGGAELLTESLHRELVARGQEVEVVRLPFNWHPNHKLNASMQAGQLLDLDQLGGHPIDLVIGLKFPAYLARHPNKVFWLIHQHRQAYEHWDEGISDMLPQPDGREMRSAIWNADRSAFAGNRMFTISQTVTDRLQKYLQIQSKPLYHPPPIAHLLTPASSEDYVLVPSRLNSEKRQDLVLRALAECSQPVRAIFVGAPDDNRIALELQALATELGVADRVIWRGAVSAEELARLYSHALAVVFVPRNEDYGYVTLEGMLAAKPLITVTDAGGPLEFIEDGRAGLVTEPSPVAVSRSLAQLWNNRSMAQELGKGAMNRYAELNINWDNIIGELLGLATVTQSLPTLRVQSDRLAGQTVRSSDENTVDGSADGNMPRTTKADYNHNPDVNAIARRAKTPNIRALFDAFEFGPNVNDEMAIYLESHWLRYLQTAALLPNRSALRILDLGAGRPHIFFGLLKLLDPKATFDAVVEKDYEAVGYESYPSRRGGPPLEISTTAFNVETDAFPYADSTYDIVLAMEVVEHLALNPAHMFREVARVLRPDGQFVVTTPNISSDMALQKIFQGHAPYSFGAFVPYHGVYGRHNREYTPHEIEDLGKLAGLSTSCLMTKDVYPAQVNDAHVFAARFPNLKNPPALRGQNIFYLGAKMGNAPDMRPSSLYLEDPFAFTGSMSATAPDANSEDLSLTFKNSGRKDWSDQTVNIVLTLIGGEGKHGRFFRFPLPLFVPAGETRTIIFPIGPRIGRASCVLLARLERRSHGWLSLIGVADIRFVADAGALDAISELLSLK